MKAHPRQTDPKQVIRDLARSRVAHAKALRWTGPPFCPREFASIFDIRCREVTHDIGGDGRILVQRDGRFRIEYRKQSMPERQRFTIFHEFAHTLFPDFGVLLPRHHAPGAALTPEEKEFENLCDIAAAEMLMPMDEFCRDIQARTAIDVAAVHELRGLYQASIDATIHRLIDLEQRCPCSAVFFTDQKGKFEGDGPLWVKYSTRGRRCRSFIWPGSIPPKDSVVFECYRNGEDVSQAAKESWLIKGSEIRCLVKAIRLPALPEFPDYAKVVALLICEE
ncbi:MAG TPA: ImmA/IrrE family metallo-endopeptidase [Lacunisphaera sp.]|nr:ImmA/IrrE family metallo-endopeptidase [Lacunisphaera sp.]